MDKRPEDPEYPQSIRVEVRFAGRTEVYELAPGDFGNVKAQIDVGYEDSEVDLTYWAPPSRSGELHRRRRIRVQIDATCGEITRRIETQPEVVKEAG